MCPKQKYNLSDATELATKRNGKCLSSNYKNTRKSMTWYCSLCNHTWNDNFYNIKNGSWCKKCSVNKQKYNLGMCHKMAIKNGGKCLESLYIQSKIYMRWECKNKHTWLAPFCEIIQGSWCKKCATNNIRLSISDAKKCAKKHNGECLSDNYTNVEEKLKWKCVSGHTWHASLNSIKNHKTWCPRCKNKTQEKLFKILKKIFPNCEVKNNYRGFDWLRTNKYRKQEIDIFIFKNGESFSLGVEYDGEQHFMPVRFNGISKKRAEDNFKRQKYLDKLKNRKIAKHQEDVKFFIRFSYKEEINYESVKNKLIKNKIIN